MKFGLHRVFVWVNIQKKFQVPRSHSIWEKCDANFVVKLLIRANVQLWILQVIIAFFSKTVWPRNMKFGLHRVSIWVNIQNKFQVPRSHSIGEKCNANFKLSSHFSRKLCDRGTWNLVCIEYQYGLIYKKNFKFLGCTVSENSAILISSYHRIFLENCVTEEHEIWFA